ncbi:MAG: DUF3501 family protein, partial [Sneathiella sp.]
VPEQDVERTTEDGKTSAIHFLHFPLTETQKKAMLTEGADVFIGIDHEQYGHMARLSDANRVSLAGDL